MTAFWGPMNYSKIFSNKILYQLKDKAQENSENYAKYF